jgi:hypothetical protein
MIATQERNKSTVDGPIKNKIKNKNKIGWWHKRGYKGDYVNWHGGKKEYKSQQILEGVKN